MDRVIFIAPLPTRPSPLQMSANVYAKVLMWPTDEKRSGKSSWITPYKAMAYINLSKKHSSVPFNNRLEAKFGPNFCNTKVPAATLPLNSEHNC